MRPEVSKSTALDEIKVSLASPSPCPTFPGCRYGTLKLLVPSRAAANRTPFVSVEVPASYCCSIWIFSSVTKIEECNYRFLLLPQCISSVVLLLRSSLGTNKTSGKHTACNAVLHSTARLLLADEMAELWNKQDPNSFLYSLPEDFLNP